MCLLRPDVIKQHKPTYLHIIFRQVNHKIDKQFLVKICPMARGYKAFQLSSDVYSNKFVFQKCASNFN